MESEANPEIKMKMEPEYRRIGGYYEFKGTQFINIEGLYSGGD